MSLPARTGLPARYNLIYLVNETGVKPPEPIARFLVRLSEASVATRYPESISRIQRVYSRSVCQGILKQSKEAVTWISAQYGSC